MAADKVAPNSVDSLTLWRISAHEMLDGVGAYKYGGRWNSVGRHVVYMAESSAGAMLEVLVHLSAVASEIPESYRLMQLEFSGFAAVETLTVPAGDRWRDQIEITRHIGDRWLERNEAPLVRVPSAVMPRTRNYLLNPAHALAAEVRVVEVSEHLYDLRLLRIRDT